MHTQRLATRIVILTLVLGLVLAGLAPPCLAKEKSRKNKRKEKATGDRSLLVTAFQEALSYRGDASAFRIESKYIKGDENEFMPLPSHLMSNGETARNYYSALAPGTTFLVETADGEKRVTVGTAPSVRMGPVFARPTTGIVVKDYSFYWKDQHFETRGIWIFYNDDGAIGRLISVEKGSADEDH